MLLRRFDICGQNFCGQKKYLRTKKLFADKKNICGQKNYLRTKPLRTQKTTTLLYTLAGFDLITHLFPGVDDSTGSRNLLTNQPNAKNLKLGERGSRNFYVRAHIFASMLADSDEDM
jgi:hypothetical protein